MRIISKKTLKDFYEQSKYHDSKNALESWHKEVLKLDWNNPNEIKEMYRNASVVGDTKVVFNIAGNKMNIKPIKSEEDYTDTLSYIESLFLDYKTNCA